MGEIDDSINIGMCVKKGDADAAAEELKTMLGEIDPNRITPVEALMKLAEMKETLAD